MRGQESVKDPDKLFINGRCGGRVFNIEDQVVRVSPRYPVEQVHSLEPSLRTGPFRDYVDPLIGDFLAYQYVIDLNYSPLLNFSEMDFVLPGPGARSGLRKCFANFGGCTEADLIRWTADHQEEEFARRGIDFRTLWGRPLQLIDCQNLFCEVDKYARVAHPEAPGLFGRTSIKRRYSHNPEPIEYRFPPKWGLNDRIAEWRAALPNTAWRRSRQPEEGA